METQNNTFIIAGAIIIAGFLVALGIFASKGSSGSTGATGDGTSVIVERDIEVDGVQADDHVRGNRDAAVTMIEYSDIQCPFCQQFHGEVQAVQASYDPAEFAWVYRHFPLDTIHPHARRYAIATECVASLGGPEAFNSFLDALIVKAQGAASLPNWVTNAELGALAQAQGVSANQLTACIASDAPQQAVEADFQAAQVAGGLGTPYNIFMLKDELSDEARTVIEGIFAGAEPGTVVVSEDGKRVAIGGGVARAQLMQIVDAMLGKN